jgi:hypothetical protein
MPESVLGIFQLRAAYDRREKNQLTAASALVHSVIWFAAARKARFGAKPGSDRHSEAALAYEFLLPQ